jgi:CRISPR-associated protein Cas2
MMVVITYDVNTSEPKGQWRLRKVSRECQNYGQRVQNSVFECLLDPHQFTDLKDHLEKIINPETDSLRYYFLGKNWKGRVGHFGAKKSYDPEGPMIV